MVSPAVVVAEGLSGLRGPVPTRFLWQRRTLGYEFIDSLTSEQPGRHAVTDATPRLDLDNDAAVLRSLTGIELLESALEDLPGGAFDPTTDNIAVIEQRLIAGQWVDFPQGVYRLETGDTRYGTDGEPIVECEAADLSIILTESGPSTPHTVADGTNYGTAVAAVIEGLGLTQNLTAVTAVLPTAQTWPAFPETTWWEVVHDLADGINYHTPWADPQGRFVWRERDVDPSQAEPDVTYSDEDEPRLIDAGTPYRRRQAAGTLRNRAVVLVDNPFHPDYPAYAERVNDDTTSPISTEHRPARLVDVKWDSTPTSTRALLDAATAGAIAETLLRREAARYETSILSTLPDPRRGAHEYVWLVIEGVEAETLWRVARWSRELRPGGRQTHHLERVRPVALTTPEAEE